jgi:O-6-methylguanine DNA methyltransferase
MNLVIKNTPPMQTYSLVPPSTNKSNEITFSIGESDIGRVLVARSNTGICTILTESNAGELRGDLSSHFPGCILVRNDQRLRGDLEKVTRFLKTGLGLPLDIRNTPFQRRVWEALRTVRVGAVITYAALARRIGQPDAIPAVVNACANSPLAIAISCHRVVRTNENLAGNGRAMEPKRI